MDADLKGYLEGINDKGLEHATLTVGNSGSALANDRRWNSK